MMSWHLFNFKWQGQQFELAKSSLRDSEVLMVMDFTQNFEHKYGQEPQSSHWYHTTTTMHPVVCYYKCLDCHNMRKEELIMLSDDMDHNAYAVKAFENKALEHLHEGGMTVMQAIQFMDNCAAQYKSHKLFDILSYRKIPFERHYFRSQHGKGPGDAAIGRVS